MRKNTGFTLIEVVVVAAIIAVFLFGVYAIFDIGVKMYAKDQTQVANQGSLRTIMTSIEKKIRKTTSTAPLLKDANGCLIINNISANPDKYCKSGSTITLNSQIVLDRIKTFNIEVSPSGNSVAIEIISISDSMGVSNSLATTYNVRLTNER